MEENQTQTEKSISQPTTETPKLNKRKYYIWIALGIIALSTVGTIGYYLGTKESIGQKASSKTTITMQEPITSTPAASISSFEKSFKDARLEGMEFNYDEKIWSVRKFSNNDSFVTQEIKNAGTGVIAINPNNQNVLLFHYTLAFGMGGGNTTFRQSDLSIVNDYWSRIRLDTSLYKDKTQYIYGARSNLIYYSQNKAELEKSIKHCSDCASGVETYCPSNEECNQIKNGERIGHVVQPVYSRSFRLKRLVPLGEINSQWAGDTYIEQAEIDDGYVIVDINYYGNNPEEADKIIKQLEEQ